MPQVPYPDLDPLIHYSSHNIFDISNIRMRPFPQGYEESAWAESYINLRGDRSYLTILCESESLARLRLAELRVAGGSVGSEYLKHLHRLNWLRQELNVFQPRLNPPGQPIQNYTVVNFQNGQTTHLNPTTARPINYGDIQSGENVPHADDEELYIENPTRVFFNNGVAVPPQSFAGEYRYVWNDRALTESPEAPNELSDDILKFMDKAGKEDKEKNAAIFSNFQKKRTVISLKVPEAAMIFSCPELEKAVSIIQIESGRKEFFLAEFDSNREATAFEETIKQNKKNEHSAILATDHERMADRKDGKIIHFVYFLARIYAKLA